MIVASGAANRHTQKGGSGGVDHIGQLILPLHQGQIRIRTFDNIVGSCHQKPGSDVSPHGISRKMFFHELVVGFVIIEGLDHVVSKMPRAWTLPIGFKAIAFGKAGEIKPVTRHSLAVVRTGQDTVDKSVPRLRRIIIKKLRHFLR